MRINLKSINKEVPLIIKSDNDLKEQFIKAAKNKLRIKNDAKFYYLSGEDTGIPGWSDSCGKSLQMEPVQPPDRHPGP